MRYYVTEIATPRDNGICHTFDDRAKAVAHFEYLVKHGITYADLVTNGSTLRKFENGIVKYWAETLQRWVTIPD